MENKDLCLELATLDNGDNVVDLLTKAGYWNDVSVWKDYGGSEHNFNIIGNQQSAADAALVEKLTNSIDAVLMAECMKRGVDPEGTDAPQSMRRAVEEFFDIPNGILSGMDVLKRSQLAERICLVATGEKQSPCFAVIDTGEGQSPKRLPETILSLSRGNKQRIPFVQGKFNMGGTGILQFCGEHNLQLIISKRHPLVAQYERDYSKDKWGFSVVRRFNPPRGYRSSIYKYLAPDGEILSFESEDLNLLPGKYPDAYSRPMEFGTFIKLYDFNIKGFKTNIILDLYYRLSLLMAESALPIRLYERRDYKSHSPEETLSGLAVRLEEDRSDNIEDNFPASAEISVRSAPLKVTIVLFKRGKAVKYRKKEGIIFLLNGQMHAPVSTQFFSRQAVGMGYLANDLLVLVDCSQLDGRSIEDLFMNSRDRMRDGKLRSLIEDELESLINDHPGLRQYRERRRREDLENSLGDFKGLEGVFEELIKESPSLSRLFLKGGRIVNPFNVTLGKPIAEYKGSFFPSFFRLQKEFSLDSPKVFHLNNNKFRIQYVTDASNDYFSRDNLPGQFKLSLNEIGVSDYDLNLWNGIATLNVFVPKDFRSGNILRFDSAVSDPTRAEPLSEIFHVEIKDPVQSGNGKKGTRKTSGEKGRGTSPQTEGLGLPRFKLVRKSEWGAHGFTERSALRVVPNGEGVKGYDYFINAENVHFLSECKRRFKVDPKLLEMRFAFAMLALGMALIDGGLPEEARESEMSIEKYVDCVSTALAECFLPLIEGLGELDIDKIEELYDDKNDTKVLAE